MEGGMLFGYSQALPYKICNAIVKDGEERRGGFHVAEKRNEGKVGSSIQDYDCLKVDRDYAMFFLSGMLNSLLNLYIFVPLLLLSQLMTSFSCQCE